MDNFHQGFTHPLVKQKVTIVSGLENSKCYCCHQNRRRNINYCVSRIGSKGKSPCYSIGDLSLPV